jgi:hypothetical protein
MDNVEYHQRLTLSVFYPFSNSLSDHVLLVAEVRESINRILDNSQDLSAAEKRAEILRRLTDLDDVPLSAGPA